MYFYVSLLFIHINKSENPENGMKVICIFTINTFLLHSKSFAGCVTSAERQASKAPTARRLISGERADSMGTCASLCVLQKPIQNYIL